MVDSFLKNVNGGIKSLTRMIAIDGFLFFVYFLCFGYCDILSKFEDLVSISRKEIFLS